MDPRALDDRDLVLAFQRGDAGAYDEIYRRHKARVDAVCYRILRNRSEADEAVQETFLRGYRALGRFNGQYQLGPWLGRIASNICLDQLRTRSRTAPVVAVPEDTIDLESHGPRTDTVVVDQLSVSQALADIQPLHARALVLRAVQGLSHVEIAHDLHMTPQQVKSLLHRSRSSFRRAWEKVSGWALAPVFAIRSSYGRERDPATGQSFAITAASPATAFVVEKVAASAVVVALALTTLPATGDGALPEADAAFPEKSGAPVVADDASFARSQRRPAPTTDPAEATSAAEQTDPVLTIEQTFETIAEPVEERFENPTAPSEQQDQPLPPEAQGASKEVVNKVKEILENAPDDLAGIAR